LIILVNQQESPLFLHNNLLVFSLYEYDSGIMPEELAYFVRHMPILQHLFVAIELTQYKSFAHYSYFEDMLPHSIVEFVFLAHIDPSISDNIETDIDKMNVYRFPMKIYRNTIYTVPLRGFLPSPLVPLEDCHQSMIDKTKSIYVGPSENQNELSAYTLKLWYHVTSIEIKVKLSSLELFRCLRTLKTGDATIVHSTLPSTLRSLELTGRLFKLSFIHINFLLFIKQIQLHLI
jgi:hypothetical protein